MLPDKSQDQDLKARPGARSETSIMKATNAAGNFPDILETILNEIVDRIEQWLEKGIKSIRVVTDHGWLLLPGGLPKAELPSSPDRKPQGALRRASRRVLP